MIIIKLELKKQPFLSKRSDSSSKKNDGISDWQTVSGEVEADYTERLHFDLVKAIHELIDNPEVVAGIRTGVTFHTSTGAIYQQQLTSIFGFNEKRSQQLIW